MVSSGSVNFLNWAYLAASIVARLLFVLATVGFFMIADNPSRTIGVFFTIRLFELAPADPAAAANTDLCASSSDSEANAVDAKDLIVLASVVVPNWFKLEETVLASLAKFATAAFTAVAEPPAFELEEPPFAFELAVPCVSGLVAACVEEACVSGLDAT